MLFPLGDDNSDRRIIPYVTWTFIAINVLVFVYQMMNPRFTMGFSVVPWEITHNEDLLETVRAGRLAIPQAPGPVPIYLTILTAMFMHGDFMHIGGNMLYLWIFGDNVEDRMGHVRFVIFYLLCGLLATVAQIAIGPESRIQNLGASGAIAGVLGGYLILFPHKNIRVIVPFGFLSQVSHMPALIVIGLWGLMQFFGGFGQLASARETGGVAYMAHVGGFIAGLVLVFLFRSRVAQRPTTRRSDDDWQS
ncbi:MAG: rhomboid family intramembrane serine protease [Blastocatellia bacterium]